MQDELVKLKSLVYNMMETTGSFTKIEIDRRMTLPDDVLEEAIKSGKAVIINQIQGDINITIYAGKILQQIDKMLMSISGKENVYKNLGLDTDSIEPAVMELYRQDVNMTEIVADFKMSLSEIATRNTKNKVEAAELAGVSRYTLEYPLKARRRLQKNDSEKNIPQISVEDHDS